MTADILARERLSEFDGVKLSAIMAGSGCGPESHINEDRKRFLMVYLHRGMPLPDIAARLGISMSLLHQIIADLQSASFIKEKEGRFYPDLLFAPRGDVNFVRAGTVEMGQRMAEWLGRDWAKMESLYDDLEIANRYPWERVCYPIVGGELIDCGMLDAFYRDASLMLPPPKRPCEHYDTVRYCWMVEEEDDDALGSRHGMTGKPLGKYHGFTFGSYNESRRQYRDALNAILATTGEDQAEQMLDEYWKMNTEPGYVPKDERIAHAWQDFPYDIPAYHYEDIKKINAFVEPYADEFIGLFKRCDSKIRALFDRTEASTYALFGDFFCWYYHLAYAECIDQLCRDGLMAIPPERFEYGIIRL